MPRNQEVECLDPARHWTFFSPLSSVSLNRSLADALPIFSKRHISILNETFTSKLQLIEWHLIVKVVLNIDWMTNCHLLPGIREYQYSEDSGGEYSSLNAGALNQCFCTLIKIFSECSLRIWKNVRRHFDGCVFYHQSQGLRWSRTNSWTNMSKDPLLLPLSR